jgi:glycosyltransferase involved in cell wall biosynthesis
MTITTIINYCTTEYRFIKKSIDSVRPFSDRIIVTFAYNFYDGSEENLDILKKTFEENPGVMFLNIEYVPNRFSNAEWCSYSRKLAIEKSNIESDYILFMDADEVVEPNLFVQFITDKYFSYGCDFKLLSYWYFREPTYRAKSHEDSVILMFRKTLQIENVMYQDRTSLFDNSSNTKFRSMTYKNQIMVHHFSWVRTKEEMIKKVTSWGHKHDRNWIDLVEHEFTHEFNGTDFVHGYQYETVDSIFI